MSEAHALDFSWTDLPTATPNLAGTGGRIREQLEDFRVVEIPSYQPVGKGSHLFIRIRKEGLTTRDAVLALVSEGLSENEIGVAGLKDKRAVTEQWLSIPNRHAAAAAALDDTPGITILEQTRHRNQLGMGHLKGNRFSIRIRGCEEDALERAQAVLTQLGVIGSPNYFGPQRFGRFGRNAVDGLRLLRGERVPGSHRLKRFFVASLQSLLFNHLLVERLNRGLYTRVAVGDWARLHQRGGTFLVESEDEAARAERLEISATLPLFGRKVKPSAGLPGALEALVLAKFGLRWVDFASRRGDRRISRIALGEVAVTDEEDGLTVSFALPKGSYATCVLREIMKVDVDALASQAT